MEHENTPNSTHPSCKVAGCQRRKSDDPLFRRMNGPASERKRAEQARVKAVHEVHGIEHERGGCR